MNVRVLFTALCIVFCINLTACNQENMSKVTIHFGEIPIAKAAEKQDLLDRLLGFFLPSAHAAWTENYNMITLTVSGEDMDTITAPVSPGSSSFTIEVPMGKSRLFTLIANDGTVKKWGGKVLADTNSSEVSLSMNVFPIVTNLTPGGEGWWVELHWDRVVGATGYRIYRASNQFGPFVYVNFVENPTEGSYAYFDESLSDGTFYYSVSVYYTQGEGEQCDQRSVTTPI